VLLEILRCGRSLQQQIVGGEKKAKKEIKTYKERRDIKLNLKRWEGGME